MTKTVRHVLSLADLGPEDIRRLVERALAIARAGDGNLGTLEGKTVGVYFRRSSTRTRTAFAVGAMRLGANVIQYGPSDLQLVTGETIGDTARVLANFLDVLVIRTNESADEMRALAAQNGMAVVNAMSESEHPTQALADLTTIVEAFGRLDGLHMLYVGEGNNTAAALALAVGMTERMRLTLVTPEGYGLPEELMARAEGFARASGAAVVQHHDAERLPEGVDVVYTTRWQTMGEPKADPDWREKFKPYAVTRELMARVSKPSGTVFLHDLPAVRGAEVTDEVLDGPQSLAFRQAKHKMTSAMAVLEWCVGAL
jgi:ornithine carbamoyltransferase